MPYSSDSENENRVVLEATETKKLIKTRGTIKGKLTLFKKYVSSLDGDNLTAEQILEIELRLEKISQVYDDFIAVQDRIEVLVSDVEPHLVERETFDNCYFQLHALCKKYIALKRSNDGGTPSSTPVKCDVTATHSSEAIKYPDIILPSFSGEMTKWIEFRDTFDALINQSNLKLIQKFKYLRSCLRDSALEVISSLDYAEDSYSIAWQLLCERFNNPRVLVFNHLRALFNIDTVPSTPTALRGMVDNITKHLRTLKTLNVRVNDWDILIIFFISGKLEKSLQRKWEEKINSRELPTLQEFKQFLRSRADLLEALGPGEAIDYTDGRRETTKKAMVTTSSTPPKVTPKVNNYHKRCPCCKEQHFINQCPKFLAMNIMSRIRTVKKIGICANCLGTNHALPNCRASTCRTCKGRHHTLLHITNEPSNSFQPTRQSQTDVTTLHGAGPETQTLNMHTNHRVGLPTRSQNDGRSQFIPKSVILSTALVNVLDNNNKYHTFRALLDSGSQSNFVTQGAFDRLGLPIQRININVTGFNDAVTPCTNSCKLVLQSTDTTFTTEPFTYLIVPKICTLPTYATNLQQLNIPERYRKHLADISFHEPGEIDLILGAEQFYILLCIGQHRLGDGLPILQKTRLGWVVSGTYSSITTKPTACNVAINQLHEFFETEEDEAATLSHDDELIQCEEIFQSHTRTSDGNFVVTIPLKSPSTTLGLSRPVVYKRFKTLESKFARDPDYRNAYVKFMNDLQKTGRMSKVTSRTESCNYLPHHAVLNPQKKTTPLRVVIDASFKTSTGTSLNDIQHKGNINQDELFNILLRFRKNKFVINADIERMYSQIYIHPNQQRLQCILWRDDPRDPLYTYVLTTLSFGLKCAPYVATRCLLQLAHENRTRYPEAARVIVDDFYMDDLIHSGDDEERVAQTAAEVSRILAGANFNLRKWSSNSDTILKKVCNATQSNTTSTSLGPQIQKVLGLAWSSNNDSLTYIIKMESNPKFLTKRIVLSLASSIFDPLGLLAPVLIIAKCFIKRLWENKSKWDDKLPISLANEWEYFYNKLSALNSLTIPRHALISDYVTLELHGFSDSSMTAYGAAVYLRSTNSCGVVSVRLICAKSRVARKETIPRLELRAAELLATLVYKVKDALKDKYLNSYLWSDSKVVLAWIKSRSQKYNPFVHNRVQKIKKCSDIESWYWVPSSDNPADLISRGVSADKLIDCNLWWHGPQWLSLQSQKWPHDKFTHLEQTTNTELFTETICNYSKNDQPNEFVSDIFKKYSCFKKLTRILAYVLRFHNNNKNKNSKYTGPLSVHELTTAELKLIQLSQIESFPKEYHLLQTNKQLPKGSNLLCLQPFLENGIIRAGGRIRQSDYAYDKKHPIILHHKSILTKLIMRYEHERLMHAGPQLLLSSIRERFWPIHGKTTANKIVNECITCFRAKPICHTPVMGNLPTSRVTPSPPFLTTGIDYAGPFLIRDRRGRGYKASKCHIAIFICFVTKAVHIELISGLESQAFLAAFRRFVSRRGKPKEMVSDNATTFHGANNELRELYSFINDKFNEFLTSCANEGIIWKFGPVYTPHLRGGLYEAAVKSCKYFIKRVLGQALLTYEEFSTILIQVEGILNSRPLCPIPNSDTDEFSVLTPAHFLIGRTPVALPDYDYKDIPANRLTHFQQLQQLQQDFWKRWSRDYICLLQQRTKWRSAKGPELHNGTLVLVKDDRAPPCRWKLGRIVRGIHGQDGITRVVDIRTAKGIIRRAWNNVCPLPISSAD